MSLEQIELWHYLIASAFLFFIIEIFTVGFVAGAIGIGLLASALASFLGASYSWQILWFAFGVILSFFAIKPIIKNLMYKESKTKTNIDAMVGKRGKVTQEIDAKKETGRVKIDGDDWKAEAIDDSTIEQGSLVEVVRLESIIVIVKKI